MNQRLTILGSGISGFGAAILASKYNYKVFVSDNNSIKDSEKALFDKHDILWEENGHTFNKILNSDLIVKSPGIPNNSKIITEIIKNNIQIFSEIEFASKYTKAKIIAVTGTNGKTTTSMILAKILKDSGRDVLLAGNIGYSFSYALSKKDYDYVVLEVSSFQLDNIIDFKPFISVLLNITPDHLDRYKGNFSQYINAKHKITLNQNQNDYIIYNYDDELVRSIKTKAKKIPISLFSSLKDDAGFYKNNKISINLNNSKMTINKLALQGTHNIFNSMAAAMAARVFEVSDDLIRQSLIDFENVEHRLEHVLKVHGIDFINDSKATNVNAAWYAVESMTKPFVWIVGGEDKGNDYSALKKIVKEKKLKAIVCLGINNDKILESFKNEVDVIVQANDMQDAVEKSYALAESGESVLLSPACASFDLYENFEHRGSEFKKQVRGL